MNRQAVVLAAIPAVGLGLLFLSRREQVGPLISETVEAVEKAIPGTWRATLDEQFRSTAVKIDEARDSMEETARLAGVRASGAIGSTLRSARQTAVAAAISSLWVGMATAFLIFVFAPERQQREKLWTTVKPAFEVAGSALTGLWNLSGQLIGSLSRGSLAPRA